MNKDQKLEKVVKMLVASAAMKQVMEFSEEQWRGILSSATDQNLDDLLLILNEEQDGYAEIEKERTRKKNVNVTRLLQRVEQYKFEAEHPDHKSKSNGK